MSLLCGIPSVTLVGDKADWESIRRRLDKLPHFGKQAEQFSRQLVPILDFFTRTFETPDDAEVVDFWSRIADVRRGGSGPSYLSGWLTALCFWNEDGKQMYDNNSQASGCQVNGTGYDKLNMDAIPVGYVSVPVTVNDNGCKIKTRMVAGSVGIAASSSGDKLDTSRTHARGYHFLGGQMQPATVEPEVGDATGQDTLQPVSGWWMYEVTK
ncbi:hypothetical protein GGR57DRAFT_333396 [Xylariaceae sp. FL1272]|nr:hypothetical protein GGR57DRAFT_333396 [Xylariaceae sp. FL1272]